MSEEIELKVAVEGFRAVRRAIRAAGGEHLGTFLQADRFFDTPDRRLRKADCGLRIRTVRVLRGAARRSDSRPMVTFKGPRQGRRRAKVRAEHQTRVDDAELLVRVFAACGLAPVLTIEKRRSSYRLGRCLIELDEVPVIGRFVEIEGPDEDAIEAARGRLHLVGETITDPYVDLVAARCGGIDTCREVTFERCAACSRGARGLSPPGCAAPPPPRARRTSPAGRSANAPG
jgi:adenylate cyclase class 2